jgi:hypothetical protein
MAISSDYPFVMRTLRFSGGEAVRSDRWFAFDFILF